MLQAIDDNIWVIEGSCVDFHGFAYPTRCVIVRLENDDLWVWSPVKLTDTLREAVGALGTPVHLVSPNKIHHLFLKDWQERYPEARLWGPSQTIEKRNDLSFEQPLSTKEPDEWAGQIDQFFVRGSFYMQEVLFYHRQSRTLIMADFSENFSEAFIEKNWKPWQRQLGRWFGIVEGKGHAPLDWRLSFWNRKPLRELKKQLLELPIDTVIMAHGEIQTEETKAFLKQSLAWI